MMKNSNRSKQYWDLSMIGLTMICPEFNQSDRKQFLSGYMLQAMESEGLVNQEHPEIFTGPAAMATIANQLEDWEDMSDGPVTTHIENIDDLREELGSSTRANLDSDVSSYNLWDESWEIAASLDSFA